MVGVLDRHRAHCGGRLRNGSVHRAAQDSLARFIRSIKADDDDLPGFFGGSNRFERSERHQVATGKHGLHVWMRLKDVLENVEALIALPICGLRSDNFDARRSFEGIAEAFQTRVTRLMTWNALACEFAALVVIRADKGRYLPFRVAQGLGIHARVNDDHWNVCAIGLVDGRYDFARTRRRDAERGDPGLDQVLDNLHLLFHIHLALSRLHDQIHSQLFSLFFGAFLHLDKEGVIGGLHHESNSGHTACLLLPSLTTYESNRQCSQQNQDQNLLHKRFSFFIVVSSECYFPRLFSAISISTATIITVPITICWIKDETPRRLRPFLRTAMISAPIKVPTTVPSPPSKLVPPITVAAIASNSYDIPAMGCAEFNRAVSRIAAKPLNNPAIPYTIVLYSLTLMPDSNAASSLPPMA